MAFILPIYDENRPTRKPYLTIFLIIINIVIFFIFYMQGSKATFSAFAEYGAIPANILRGEKLWTLVTSMFMHADIIHLGGNMVFLWIFGDNIEDTLGRNRYLIFYLIGGIGATFAHIASTLIAGYTSAIPFFVPDLETPSVGASGAISAVLGAYLLLYPRARIKTVVFLGFFITFTSIPALYYLGFWFLYQLLMGFVALFGAPSNVAFWAHVGGYVFGIAVMKAFDIKPKTRLRQPQIGGPVRPVAAPMTIRPLVDVILEDSRVLVLARIPGVDGKKININVSTRVVSISADYQDLRFRRQITLPVPVIPSPRNVIYKNGVLSFTLDRIQ